MRKSLETWIDHGVICETEPNTLLLLEEAGSAKAGERRAPVRHGAYHSVHGFYQTKLSMPAVIEEQAPSVSSAQQEEAEQMRVYWKFIEGMLTNLGQLPLDRIQTMLKFAPNYSKSVDQLNIFMEAARREGLVTVNNGMWKLNR